MLDIRDEMPGKDEDDSLTTLRRQAARDWKLRGNDFFTHGKYEDALTCYEKALEFDPGYSDVWNNRAMVLSRLGRTEEAGECRKKVNEIKIRQTMERAIRADRILVALEKKDASGSDLGSGEPMNADNTEKSA
jgi:tetratricopeptide (TPR) repeat protein